MSDDNTAHIVEQEKRCALCHRQGYFGTIVQPEPGKQVAGPDYCRRHLEVSIVELATQFITVVVGINGRVA